MAAICPNTATRIPAIADAFWTEPMTSPTDPLAVLGADRAAAVHRRDDLMQQFRRTVEASKDSNADDEHDFEGATIAYERSQLAALVDQARRRLTEIDTAVFRVQAGTYAVCEVCGRPDGGSVRHERHRPACASRAYLSHRGRRRAARWSGGGREVERARVPFKLIR